MKSIRLLSSHKQEIYRRIIVIFKLNLISCSSIILPVGHVITEDFDILNNKQLNGLLAKRQNQKEVRII